MGNIKNKPRAPAPQIIYMPQPVYQTPDNADGGDGEDAKTPEQIVAERREKNLLSRNRSRLGTVLTGFRGILTPSASDTQKKTLLGE